MLTRWRQDNDAVTGNWFPAVREAAVCVVHWMRRERGHLCTGVSIVRRLTWKAIFSLTCGMAIIASTE